LFLLLEIKTPDILDPSLPPKIGYLTVVDMAGVENPLAIGKQYYKLYDAADKPSTGYAKTIRDLDKDVQEREIFTFNPLPAYTGPLQPVIFWKSYKMGGIQYKFDQLKYIGKVGPIDSRYPPYANPDNYFRNATNIENWIRQMMREGLYINETINQLRYYFESQKGIQSNIVMNRGLRSPNFNLQGVDTTNWLDLISDYNPSSFFYDPRSRSNPIAIIAIITEIRSIAQGALNNDEIAFNEAMASLYGVQKIDKNIIAMLSLSRTEFIEEPPTGEDARTEEAAARFIIERRNKRLEDVTTTLEYAAKFAAKIVVK